MAYRGGKAYSSESAHEFLKDIECVHAERLMPFAQGHRGLIFRGKIKEKFKEKFKGMGAQRDVIIKAKNPRSDAPSALMREARFLREANALGIGPRLLFEEKQCIVMEYIDGSLFEEWIAQRTRSRAEVFSAIVEVCRQCLLMDCASFSKEEMQNPYKHIIMRKCPQGWEPVLIDFERAHRTPKPQNFTQCVQYFTSARMGYLLGRWEIFFAKERAIEAMKRYKREGAGLRILLELGKKDHAAKGDKAGKANKMKRMRSRRDPPMQDEAWRVAQRMVEGIMAHNTPGSISEQSKSMQSMPRQSLPKQGMRTSVRTNFKKKDGDGRLRERVYELISRIPSGKVATYRSVAHALGTKAYRAVGQALRSNPHAPAVPCHRVIASDGTLGGYNGEAHSTKKARMLRSEGIIIVNGKVNLDCFEYRFSEPMSR